MKKKLNFLFAHGFRLWRTKANEWCLTNKKSLEHSVFFFSNLDCQSCMCVSRVMVLMQSLCFARASPYRIVCYGIPALVLKRSKRMGTFNSFTRDSCFVLQRMEKRSID